MSNFNLIARAGQVDLVVGTSGSGDDSRTLSIPFGSLDSSGLPEAIKLSIQAADGISVPQAEIVCQAFRDAQGTVTLGPTFSERSSANLGSEPVKVGSILCSDFKGLQRQIDGASNRDNASSNGQATPTAGIVPSATIASTNPAPEQQSQAPQSIAAIPSAGNSKPKTLPQPVATSIATTTKASPTVNGDDKPSEQPSTAPPNTNSPAATTTSVPQPVATNTITSATAQQTTSGANEGYHRYGWTLKKVLSVGLVTTCFLRWL